MSAFTYPGVYIEELSSGVHTIAGVATSIAAFIGWAPQGPVTEATLVESWPEYQTLFGGLDSRSLLGYSVNQFFANGGQQAYIVRLVWDGSLPAAPGTSPAPCATAAATGVGFASSEIQASLGSIASNLVTLYVGTPVLESITIEPADVPPIPINAAPLQFTAKGIKSDGSPAPALTPTWVSSDPTGIISISSGGQAIVVGPGTATLTATDPSGLISGSVTVTVVSAKLNAINVVPNPVSAAAGQTKQLAATGVYSDSTTQNLTDAVAWSTSLAPAKATISSTGLLAADNAATAASGTLKADWAGVSGSGTVNVTAAVITSVVITPLSPTILTSQALKFNAVGIDSYDPPPPPAVPTPPPPVALSGAIWDSSNEAVAKIDSTGKVTVIGAGSTTITVTSNAATGSIQASTTLTVVAASVTLTSIAVTPASVSLANGLSQQMKALGTYSDGSTADLTGSAAWTSSSNTNASVTPNGGLVTGKKVTGAPVTITAAWGGQNGTASVTVTAPVLESIAITPPAIGTIPDAVTIPSASTRQFKAMGTFSDLTTKDLTTTATWSSSTPAAATVVASGATGGLATAVAAGGSLTLFANNPGSWGNNLRVSVSVLPPPNTNRFNLLVQQVNAKGQLQTLETFVNLSTTSADPQYAVTVVDNDSSYITFINPATMTAVVPTAAPSPTASPVIFAGGADGAVLVPASDGNFENALIPTTGVGGVHLLDTMDIFNLLCVPAETNATSIQELQKYCHDKRAFYIVDPPQATSISNLISSGPVGSTAGSITGQYSMNSAYYFPWVQAPDPLFGNRPALYPPCGFVAGIYAATDASRRVWKAPAGIDASLTGNSGLQYTLTDLQNGSLNIQAVNCLREFKIYGDVVWGARTLQGNDHAGSEWKYVPIRRLALFLESSLYDGTQWVVFEPNDEPLWSQIRLNIGAFMQDLFLKGAFQGTTPQQAYFVRCDSSNNPQSSIDLGIVNILVGFAPLYPAEFVVIQIQQMAGQIS
jgi:phage tail sheath protein FI